MFCRGGCVWLCVSFECSMLGYLGVLVVVLCGGVAGVVWGDMGWVLCCFCFY